MPIKNIKEKKTVAYVVAYSDSNYFYDIFRGYIFVNIIFFIGLLVLSLLIAKIIKQSFYLQIRIDEEVEKNKKQQQNMLIQSRMAQLGEMISMIAHQWRQPLAIVSMISMNLLERI